MKALTIIITIIPVYYYSLTRLGLHYKNIKPNNLKSNHNIN